MMFRNASLTLVLLSFALLGLNAQCENWMASSQRDDAENAHSIYRAALKTGDLDIAFENWQIAYEIAPAADGNRDSHYTDGIKIYKQLYKGSTDDVIKKKYGVEILKLYDHAIECHRSKAIRLKCDADEDCYKNRISYLQGRREEDRKLMSNF